MTTKGIGFRIAVLCACAMACGTPQDKAPVLERNFAESLSTLAAGDRAEPVNRQWMEKALRALNEWYANERLLASETDARTKLNQKLGKLWHTIYEAANAKEAEGDSPLGSTSLDINFLVIEVAMSKDFVTHATWVEGEPLLYLLGDSLGAVNERLADSVFLHDFACTFRGCYQNAVHTEVSELVGIFAALADGDVFHHRFISAHKIREPWRRALAALDENHPVLRRAVAQAAKAASFDPRLLTALNPEATEPVPFLALSSVVQQSIQWSTSYAKQGLFEQRQGREIYSGVQSGRTQHIKQMVERRRQSLHNTVVEFQRGRDQFVALTKERLRAESYENRVDAELEENAKNMAFLGRQLEHVRRDIAAVEDTYANFMQEFNKGAAAAEFDRNQRMQVGNSHSLMFSGAEARAGGDLRSIAVRGPTETWSMNLSAGEIVNVSSGGSWSPSCALQLAGSINGIRVDAGAAYESITGPEGYSATVVNGTYALTSVQHAEAASSSQSKSRQETDSVSGGGGFQAPAILAVLGINAHAGGARSDTQSTESSTGTATTDTTASTNGTDSKTSLALLAGLRAPGTPFPSHPAGSLLFVQEDNSGNIVHADIVRSPLTSILIKQPGTGYLVVNDRVDTRCRSRNEQLTINVSKTRGIDSQMAEISSAMAKSLDTAEQRIADKANGMLIASDVAAISSEAYKELAINCKCQPAQLPEAMQALFKAALDRSLSGLERRIRAKSLVHEIDILRLKAKVLEEDRKIATSDRRLDASMTFWATQSADVTMLRWQARSLVTFIGEDLYPLLQLRYPRVLSELRGDVVFNAQLRALTDSPWDTSFVSKPHGNQRFEDYTGPLRNVLNSVAMLSDTVEGTDARGWEPAGADSHIVALSFPRHHGTSRSSWLTADEMQALNFWNAVEKQSSVSIKIRPEHLYSSVVAAPGRLSCFKQLPIIRSMGLFFSLPPQASNRELNSADMGIVTLVDRHQLFATTQGPEIYVLSDFAWRQPELRLLFGGSRDALDIFRERARGLASGNGLSPFATFRFDFDQLYPETAALLNASEEAILIFDVETMPGPEGRIGWVESCK